MTNLRLMKRFNFGPKLPDPAAAAPPKDAKAPPTPAPAPGAKPGKPEKKEIERRYTWGIGIGSENILNHRNLAQPVGVLGSPLFGQSTALHNAWGESGSANRTVNLETFFRF